MVIMMIRTGVAGDLQGIGKVVIEELSLKQRVSTWSPSRKRA